MDILKIGTRLARISEIVIEFIQMNFPYGGPHCPSVPLQQYIITTQISGQPYICNHPNWYLQPAVYPLPAAECYLPLLFNGVDMSNSTLPMPSSFQTKEVEPCTPSSRTSKLDQLRTNDINNKMNGRSHTMLPKSRAPAVSLISDSKVRLSHVPQSDDLWLPSSASFPGVHDTGSRSTFISPNASNLGSPQSHSSEATSFDNQFKNEPASPNITRASRERNKYPDVVRRVNEASDEQRYIDDITEHLGQRLQLCGPEPSIPSPQPPLEVVASTDSNLESKRSKKRRRARFDLSQHPPQVKVETTFMGPKRQETVKSESRPLRMGDPTSWAAVAAAPPNLKTPEVRVLKRTELLPTTSTVIAGTSSPSRMRKRALRAQCNPRHGGHLTDLMKERMLLRYRSLLAQTTAPKRRGKERLTPKRKPHSHLKAGILGDRLVRRMSRQQAQPCEGQSTLAEDACTVVKIVLPSMPDLEALVEEMVKKLAEFHDRAYKQTADAPAKRKNTRRIVCGFHEVIKSLKLNKLKFLIIAGDLEKGAYEIEETRANQPEAASLPKKSNALAKTLRQAVDMARERGCPVMLAFKRRYLQKLCHKGAPSTLDGGAGINRDGVLNVHRSDIEHQSADWKVEEKVQQQCCHQLGGFGGLCRRGSELSPRGMLLAWKRSEDSPNKNLLQLVSKSGKSGVILCLRTLLIEQARFGWIL
ncbi:hypothetical protein TcWFU_009833 [Taenia crassiceps]|uniref:Ribosomal protein eL8/eL30/eS12/Gadd45 domain-containing protein n=1 Tax=Taenia crassiceps TaxID=6207 RepID=A0ABR4QNL7_9CEST